MMMMMKKHKHIPHCLRTVPRGEGSAHLGPRSHFLHRLLSFSFSQPASPTRSDRKRQGKTGLSPKHTQTGCCSSASAAFSFSIHHPHCTLIKQKMLPLIVVFVVVQGLSVFPSLSWQVLPWQFGVKEDSSALLFC